MKSYKIFIPESDSRAEIHEAVQNHAVKLGWRHNLNMSTILKYLFFFRDGFVNTSGNEIVFNEYEFPQISWQDFIRLTPADVRDENRNDISERRKAHEIQKNDRNEKAWDILKVIVGGRMSSFKTLEDDPGFEKHIKLAFRYADEFIRQSGDNEKSE